MIKRLVLAFLIAPALPSLLDGLLSIARNIASADSSLETAQLFSPLLITVSYLCAGLIGIPVYLLLRRQLGRTWWKYVLAGCLTGCAPALLIIMTASDEPSGLGSGIATIAAVIGLIYGAVGGLAFWLIGIAERTGKNT